MFAVNAAILGTWAPRVPALAENVGARPGTLGLGLLGASAGLFLAASFAGVLVERLGTRATTGIFTVASSLVLPLVGLSRSVVVLGATLFVLGITVGLVNVAMNVAGVGIERRTGRSVLPLFHAGASGGALAGSALAGVAAAHDVPPATHFSLAGVVMAGALALVLRGIPELSETRSGEPAVVRTGKRTRPRYSAVLFYLAAIAFCSAITEGASADWSALLLVDVRRTSQSAAALGYSAFVLGMMAARLGGAWLRQSWGSTRVLSVGAVLAAVSLVAAATVPSVPATYAGFSLAGVGVASTFPIVLSLAGDHGKRHDGSGGEREMAFVSAIGYSGFVSGPAVLGFVVQHTSLSVAFVVVGAMVALIAPLIYRTDRTARPRYALHVMDHVPAQERFPTPATPADDQRHESLA